MVRIQLVGSLGRNGPRCLILALTAALLTACSAGERANARIEAELRATGGVPLLTTGEPSEAQAGAPAPEPQLDEEPEEQAAEPAPTPIVSGYSDDSVRCGDAWLDEDELCEIGAREGDFDACPTHCEATPDCPEPQLILRSCWTQCSC